MQRGDDHEHSDPGVGFLPISETSVKLSTLKSDIKGEVSKPHRKEAD